MSTEPSPPYGNKISASIERRENTFLRWVIGIGLGMITVLGAVVWNRVAAQTDKNTDKLSDHSLILQRLDLDAAADRRESSARWSEVRAWLQALGQRLNVQQPPPGITP